MLEILRDEGIPTVCWMTPVLPFINDTEENIRGLLEYCCRAKTYGILTFGMGVTLRDGDRQYFYRKLDEHFPGLRERYVKTYGDADEVPSPNQAELMKLLRRVCKEQGIVCDADEIFRYLSRFEDKLAGTQMSLFDF